MLENFKKFKIEKEQLITIHAGQTGGGADTGHGDDPGDDDKKTEPEFCPDWYPQYLCSTPN